MKSTKNIISPIFFNLTEGKMANTIANQRATVSEK
jgi:hypothetical protein